VVQWENRYKNNKAGSLDIERVQENALEVFIDYGNRNGHSLF
jgi:hypothetical protein